jgi:hypothetical protein
LTKISKSEAFGGLRLGWRCPAGQFAKRLEQDQDRVAATH